MTVRNRVRRNNTTWQLRALAGLSFILIVTLAIVNGAHALDERFSMQIKDKTLGEAFQSLARMSGYRISFDKEWTDEPINARFVNLTLEMAIAKILTNFNHVVIFEQDAIQVKIYGVVTPDKGVHQVAAEDSDIRSPARPFAMSTRQKDEMEGESASEEVTEPETSETEPEENTNEETTPAERDEKDETEKTPPEESKEGQSSKESD